MDRKRWLLAGVVAVATWILVMLTLREIAASARPAPRPCLMLCIEDPEAAPQCTRVCADDADEVDRAPR